VKVGHCQAPIEKPALDESGLFLFVLRSFRVRASVIFLIPLLLLCEVLRSPSAHSPEQRAAATGA
jgi:hypothetical protein